MFHCNSHSPSIAFGWFCLTLHKAEESCLVWPNLSLARTVSIRLLLFWDEVQSLTSFLISLSFLPSRAKEFHSRCHPLVMASLSSLLISVWGPLLWGELSEPIPGRGEGFINYIIYFFLSLFIFLEPFYPKTNIGGPGCIPVSPPPPLNPPLIWCGFEI